MLKQLWCVNLFIGYVFDGEPLAVFNEGASVSLCSVTTVT